MERSKPDKRLLALVALAHLSVTAITWRDLRHRPEAGLRGSKRLWRILSSLNTIGSAAYFLWGRRPLDRSGAGGEG